MNSKLPEKERKMIYSEFRGLSTVNNIQRIFTGKKFKKSDFFGLPARPTVHK